MTKYRVEIDNEKTVRWYKWETIELHREDGPAVEWVDGCNSWWLNNKLHRKDGPAVKRSDGNKEWFLNGKCHREDGPAIEYANGNKSWYLNGEHLSEKEWNKKVNKDDCEGKTIEIDGVEYELRKPKTNVCQ